MFRPTKRQRVECPPSWMDCEGLLTVPAPPPPPPSSSGTAAQEDGLESSEHCPSMITTPVASALTKEIFLDRFRKEIVDRYRFSLSSREPLLLSNNPSGASVITDDEARKIRPLLRSRIAIGFNECTRLLEQAASAATTSANRGSPLPTDPSSSAVLQDQAPLLVVACAEGLRLAPTILVHVPVLARRLNVPLLLLPGSAAGRDLGRLLLVRRATLLALLPRQRPSSDPEAAADAAAAPVAASVDPGESNVNDDPLEERVHSDVDSFVTFILSKM